MERLARWRTELALKAAESLADPTDLYRCNESELLTILGEPIDAVEARTPAPAWISNLALDFDAAPEPPEWLQSFDIGPGVEFLVVLAAPISAAKSRLRDRMVALKQRYPEAPFSCGSAPELLFDHLVPRIARLLIRPLVVELHADRLMGRAQGASSRRRFESFVARIGDRESSLALLQEYPVLARLAMETLADWEEVSAEFMTRLAQDWDPLVRTLGLRRSDQLSDVHTHGDRHRGGRSVMVASFRSGAKIVYKPRPMRVEAHFQTLLRWLNARGDVLPFRAISVIDRENYGWSEFIPVVPCATHAERRRFYRRQGGYLALLYALAASDFHFENVLASSDHPILVDLECLFQPMPPSESDSIMGVERAAADAARQSVLAVGLLPRPDLVGPSGVTDLSGLGAAPGDVMPVRLPDWDEVGTDEMHQVLRRLEIDATQHRPHDSGTDVAVADFVDDLCEGFADTYRTLWRHRETLLGDDGPLKRFSECATRFILRPTLDYGLLLDSSLHPHFLRDGLERDRRFDRLVGTVTWGCEIEAAEHRDLWRGDIPLFSARPDSRHIWDSAGGQIDNFFKETGWDVVTGRLEQLSEDDLERQTWIVRVSVASSRLPPDTVDYSRPARLSSSPQGVDGDRLIVAAQTVGQRLSDLAIRADGEATWIGVRSTQGSHWHVGPIGVDLYNGLAGVCLFLSYLSRVVGEPQYMALAQAAYPVLRRQVERELSHLSCGAFDGAGGLIYALTHLGVLWRDATVLDEAATLVDSVPALLEARPESDIISGAAGCIAALLSVSNSIPFERCEEVLLDCGSYLLDSAIGMDEGIAWPAPQPTWKPLGGFAHGAAGIAWSLLELAAATQDGRFRNAGLAAIAYQRSLFSPNAQNWRDLRVLEAPALLRRDGDGNFMSHWCHGAAGVGLAWLACSSHLDDAELHEEIAIATRTTRETGFGFNHSLCHGDLGNADVLLRAAEAGIEISMDEIGALTSEILGSIESNGWITGYPFGLEAPGLMMGLAGIGLGLLKLAAPNDVPSVLLLESPPSAAEYR